MRRKLTITILTGLLLVSFWQLTANVSAQSRLTLAMILTGLQTKGKTPETSTLPKRNIYITKRVETYGVTFRLTPEIEKELRLSGASTVLINAISDNGPVVTPTPRIPTTTGKPSALFKDLWVDYGVTEGGELGMRIHVKFTAYKMKGLSSYLAIYFLDKSGNSLKDDNGKFNSSSGDVAVYKEMNPGYDPADFDDLTVFMPYDELDLGAGNWNLKMDAKLIYKTGGAIQQLTVKDFNYKKGNSVNNNEVDSDAVVVKSNRVWVENNITVNGQKGTRIHVNFEVNGLKGVDAKLVIRLQKEDNTYLLNNANGFSNDEGELQLEYPIKPGFEPTVYKDLDVFLPYNQIKLGRGDWQLKFDIDVDFDDQIKHMTFHPFPFERS